MKIVRKKQKIYIRYFHFFNLAFYVIYHNTNKLIYNNVWFTAPKTIFSKSWNIMKSSKIPIRYQLCITFLDQEKTVFPISEKFKTRTIPHSKSMVFHVEENIILHQLFKSKEDRIFHLRKLQNKNFSVFRKHGIPC